MNFKPRQLQPVRRPELSDAKVLGDVSLESRLLVSVGAVGFAFERDGMDWTGGEAVTVGRGQDLDEAWLTAARLVAIEALRGEIGKTGGEERAAGTIQCPVCARLLCSPELVDVAKRTGIDCAPAHSVYFEDGRELVFRPDGTAVWQAAP